MSLAFPETVSVLRRAISLGLISLADVIAWSERIMEHEGEPDIWCVELSIASEHEVLSILRGVTGEIEPIMVLKGICGLLYNQWKRRLVSIDVLSDITWELQYSGELAAVLGSTDESAEWGTQIFCLRREYVLAWKSKDEIYELIGQVISPANRWQGLIPYWVES